MKKSILLVVALIAVSISSCSSDDENVEVSLSGKWEPVKQGIVISGQELVEDFEHTVGCNKNYAEFTATTTIQHDFEKNMSNQCVEETYTYNYSRTGNTITILQDGELLTLTILELNATTLKLSGQEDFGGETPIQTILIMKRI